MAAIGLCLSDWFERWFPDAFALALTTALLVVAASISMGNGVVQSAQWFGAGFWDLTTFTMQISMLIVSGNVLANAPPVRSVVRMLAAIPSSPRGAVAFVAVFSMLSSLVSWTFSLIFSGLLAREVTHRVRGADYRATGAAAYLGVGGVWAFGLTSSAALIMATPASLPESVLRISGVIPLSQTLGLWQSFVVTGALLVVSVLIAYFSAPEPEHARSMEEMGVVYEAAVPDTSHPEKPGEWLEHSPALTIVAALLGVGFLGAEVAAKGPAVLLDLNHYIFLFVIAGLALHVRPRSFVRSVNLAAGSVGGVLVQFPIYAGIVKVITESGVAQKMAHFFIAVSTADTFPIWVGVYSVLLGLFVPSAGGKWLVEAPYVLEAAKSLHVHLGWVVQTYNATESLANLIHPFWMLPLLGILGLKPRDIVGYATLQFVVHVPLVLFLVWALNQTLL